MSPWTDYAEEINAARRAERRRCAVAVAGMVTGVALGSVGLGALIGLGGWPLGLAAAGLVGWFGWSVCVLHRSGGM